MPLLIFFFFFNDTATTEIYTLSLHDALPISDIAATDHEQGRNAGSAAQHLEGPLPAQSVQDAMRYPAELRDRKSTRLSSSHSQISYAVFCLKKKKSRAIIMISNTEHNIFLYV